jgi:hypothetical protein
MIRYVHVNIEDYEIINKFAFLDTITDQFVYFNGEFLFSSLDDFVDNYNQEPNPHSEIERFTNKIPDDKKVIKKEEIPENPCEACREPYECPPSALCGERHAYQKALKGVDDVSGN